MKPWRCDPYLWVHLAGLATVPLWIDLCLLGLAVGNPTWPGLELGFIVAVGVLPVLVMQLRRPFYIFSLPGLALRPRALAEDQRRLLTQFRRWRVRLGALLIPVPLVWALVKLYPLAFLAHDITPFGDWGRWGGVAIAALSFFLANLFLQVPVAVLQVLATPDRRMQQVLPYTVDQIAADFTLLGLPVGKILPAITFVEPGVEPGFAASSAPESGETEIYGPVDGMMASINGDPIDIDASAKHLGVDTDEAAQGGGAHHLGDDFVQPHPEVDESAMTQALITDGAIAPEHPATAFGEAVPISAANIPRVPVDAFTQNI